MNVRSLKSYKVGMCDVLDKLAQMGEHAEVAVRLSQEAVLRKKKKLMAPILEGKHLDAIHVQAKITICRRLNEELEYLEALREEIKGRSNMQAGSFKFNPDGL